MRGRRAVRGPAYDGLFALPAAAVTFQASANFVMTGRGGICFRGAQGAAFADTMAQVRELLDADEGPPVELAKDEFGFTWLLTRQDDMSAMATDLHAVATSLEAQGFGGSILCSVVPFRDPSGREVALVYLQKSGAFYPFAPTGAQTRDNVLELQVKELLKEDMPIEPDLSRWMALWGAPVLSADR